MGPAASHLVALHWVGGGTYRILFVSRFWRKNSKIGAKIQKSGAKIQKSQKKICHYVAKTFFFGKSPFYPVLVGLRPMGGGRGVKVASYLLGWGQRGGWKHLEGSRLHLCFAINCSRILVKSYNIFRKIQYVDSWVHFISFYGRGSFGMDSCTSIAVHFKRVFSNAGDLSKWARVGTELDR